MRILHAFLFFSVSTGGGTTDHLYKLARAQSLRGHEVTIYTGDYGLDPSYVRSLNGVRVRVFRSWLNSGFYVMPGLIPVARRELPSFDVIHMHLFRSFQNIVLHHFAKKFGIPYVMDSHGSLGRHERKRRVKAAFDHVFGRRLLRDAARCIGETDMGVRENLEHGVAPDKVVRMVSPFSVEEFADLPSAGLFRQRFGIEDSCRIVMFLGRIHRIKGIDILTECFARLAQRRKDVRLVIVGPDDRYRSTIEALVDRLGIREKVLFTGFLAGRDKLAALVDADVVVQTSRYEAGARPPIEAVLCGTPTIVSNNSGAGEDVRRMDAGYLVRFGDLEDLCQKIEYVLSHPNEARAKTLAAKAYVEQNLSMAHCVEKYIDLYKVCVQETTAARRGDRL